MSKLLLMILLCGYCVAQNNCSTAEIPIGIKRDLAIAQLREQGCKLRLGEPTKDSVQDDIVIPATRDSEFEYFELISIDGKVGAVWTYTPYFESAQKAFDALFKVLVLNSKMDSGKGADLLAQRHFLGQITLQRPLTTGDPSIFFDLNDGSVVLENRTKKAGVRVARVRNR
jgi:hypothetical protein